MLGLDRCLAWMSLEGVEDDGGRLLLLVFGRWSLWVLGYFLEVCERLANVVLVENSFGS